MNERREADDLEAVEARLRGLRPRGVSLDVEAILAAGRRPTTAAAAPLPRPRRFGLAVASWLGGLATGVAVTLLGVWLAADRRPATAEAQAPRPLPTPVSTVATRGERPAWRPASGNIPESIGQPWLAGALAAGVAQLTATDPAQRRPANDRSPWRITLEELQR
jgi:hypothetical protein